MAIRQNDNGIIYGLTYIDHNTKCVFNGSDIGKDYSAKAILNKCGISQHTPSQVKPIEPKISDTTSKELSLDKNQHQEQDLSKIIEVIITPVQEYQNLPFKFRKRRKKKW